jgi:cell division septation protein DedD
MKKRRNIFSLILMLTLLTVQCIKRDQTEPEQRDEGETVLPLDERGFDPLELPVDREIVPLENPQPGPISGEDSLLSPGAQTLSEDTSATPEVNTSEAIDTLNSQVYRVQLFTSTIYGEARQAAVVAEEIFDRPVVVDFEVPYFKVRVGAFGSRDDAEVYQQKARAAGYDNAWVVIATTNVRKAPSMYEGLPGLETLSDSISEDSGSGDGEKR